MVAGRAPPVQAPRRPSLRIIPLAFSSIGDPESRVTA
jgi:hypothetical protein